MPEVSIVVPVYQVEDYLERCVSSILAQTFQDFELILVDDGSKDNSGALCDVWREKDPRIRVIHKENGGLSSARNAGLKIAQGAYIGFVDSDDWIHPQMYEILYQLIRERQADISCGGVVKVDSVTEPAAVIFPNVREYSQEQFASRYFKISGNETVHYAVNKLYRQEIAKKMSFPEGLINEDVEGFCLALLEAKKIVETDDVLYFYRVNPDGISYRWFSEKQMDLLTVWGRVVEICRKRKPEWTPYAELNYQRAYFGLLCRCLLSGESDRFPLEKERLREGLKRYYPALIRSPMPLNRKVIMTALRYQYGLTERLFLLWKRVRGRKR